MKRLLIVLLTICMLLCACGEKHDGVYTVEEMGTNYKTQGRTIVYEGKGIALLSTADSFEFNADCEGKVSVTLVGEDMEDAPRDVIVFFTVYVDGERLEVRPEINNGVEYELVFAENLEKGEHHFRIVRQSEWENGRVYVKQINTTGKLLDAPTDREIFIEFIGDSIATGFGNMPDIEFEYEWGGHPIWEDGTQAFAYMAAEKLNADYSIVAIEGIGSVGGYWGFTMNEIYEYYPRVNEKDYSYTPERTADIVVVELFSNDHATMREKGYTPSDIVSNGKELIEMARAKHPESKVVVLPGALYKKFETMINEELGGVENGYYCVDVPLNTAGKSGHPDVAGHTEAADALVEVLKPIIEEIKK
ncbi:MAG: hypothetical protein IJB24_05815 [Clostridia bacterium]|nr:hypothetical protein [Clostridia bacterium]